MAATWGAQDPAGLDDGVKDRRYHGRQGSREFRPEVIHGVTGL